MTPAESAAVSPPASAVARLARRVSGLSGWRRWAAAFAFGALAAAALPPVHALPLLIVSFAGLVWLLDGAPGARRAFVDGWMFFGGFSAAGLYWISNALLVDAGQFAWLIPFAALGLPLALGLFGGIMTLLARKFWVPGPGRACVLAACWTLMEGVRGVVLTGFPWNPVGNVWVAFEPVLQAAAWIGVYGLSAITVWAAAGFATLGDGGRKSAHRWGAALSGTAVLAALAVAGAVRLAGAPPVSGDPDANVPGVVLRIVQPNIAQRDKWLPQRRARNFATHLEMSGVAGDGKATHVIWPETAAPFGVTTDPARRALMRIAVPPGGSLITGAPRFAVAPGRPTRIWNGLVAVNDAGAVAATYDKHHLVPFGEYVPFRDLLPLEKITAGSVDFSAGPGLVTLRLPGLPSFSPLICYEAIFPGRVVAPGERPGFLLNITNDGWFGISAGPHQHFASARLRAVEEGLPLVRAANTGISGVVDSYGRIVAAIGLGTRGVLDSALPKSAAKPPLFARYGNAIPMILAAILFLAGILSCRISRF